MPVGWTKASRYLIWYVKIDFTKKTRWVMDGYRTADP